MEENKYMVPIAIIIAGVLIGWGFYSSKGNEIKPENTTNNPEQINQESIKINFKDSDHILGNPDAKIKIITFSDFECPYCADFHETMIKITDEYAKNGKVAWTMRQFPVHGVPTQIKAVASECAGKLGGEAKFWEMTKEIFKTTATGWIKIEELPVIAMSLGLDTTDFNACLENQEVNKKAQEDFQNGIDLGIEGTPHSIIITESGEQFPLEGARPYSEIKGMIEMILAQ
ncbi:DsbA family protein [Patescibacteria group bacterium]|nr:DsbA family protein [Patescibacteria group bacterium]